MAFDNPNVINRFGKSQAASMWTQAAVNMALDRREEFRIYFPVYGTYVCHYIDPVSGLAYAEEHSVN